MMHPFSIPSKTQPLATQCSTATASACPSLRYYNFNRELNERRAFCSFVFQLLWLLAGSINRTTDFLPSSSGLICDFDISSVARIFEFFFLSCQKKKKQFPAFSIGIFKDRSLDGWIDLAASDEPMCFSDVILRIFTDTDCGSVSFAKQVPFQPANKGFFAQHSFASYTGCYGYPRGCHLPLWRRVFSADNRLLQIHRRPSSVNYIRTSP